MKTKKMNYVLVPLTLIVLLSIGLVSVHAIECPLGSNGDMMTMGDMAGARGEGRESARREMRGGMQHLVMLAVALDFTDAQNAQVKEIAAVNREKKRILRQQLHQGRQQLHQLMENERFDEVAFRAAAGQVAAKKTDMMVMRVQMRQAVFAVMTPEQREKAKKLKQVMAPKRRGKKGEQRSAR